MLPSDRILLLLFFLAMTISSLVILTSSPHLKLDMDDTSEKEDWFEWGILRLVFWEAMTWCEAATSLGRSLSFIWHSGILTISENVIFYHCIITSFLTEMLHHLYVLCLGCVLVSDFVYNKSTINVIFLWDFKHTLSISDKAYTYTKSCSFVITKVYESKVLRLFCGARHM